MSSANKTRETAIRASQGNFAGKWRAIFRSRQRMHDPILVFNISIFNIDDGWNRIFNPLKAHENGSR